jgi:hypothetical protein
MAEDNTISAIDTTNESNLTMAATNAVFGTYELLESIILALPPEDIFLAARVCNKWNDIVTSSTAIEKRLKATPLFLLESENDASTDSHVTYLLLDSCDVFIQHVKGGEVVALLRNKNGTLIRANSYQVSQRQRENHRLDIEGLCSP